MREADSRRSIRSAPIAFLAITVLAVACEREASTDTDLANRVPPAGDTAGAVPGPGAPADVTAANTPVDTTRTRVVEAAQAGVQTPASLLDSATVDLDRDGDREMLLLYAAAERDDRGRLMWDDGQRWLLLARDGEREFPIFDGFVQLGRLGFHVIERGDAEPPLLVLREETGAGLRIWTYTYDAAAGAFHGTLVLEATGNVVHATPPLGGP